jgi:Cu2+-containing amine oxidase
VRKAGQHVRISPQLVSGKDGGHLWADRYDRDLTDIFAIQDEITHEIVTQLTVKLLPGERDRAREWAARAPLGRRRNQWPRPASGRTGRCRRARPAQAQATKSRKRRQMRVKHWIGGASGLALLLAGAGVASAHPLDGLSAEEMTETVSILKAEGRTTDDTRFPLIELKEPDKAVVLAWQPGQPAPRLVTVNVKEAAGTFKGEVDLAARKVVSWAPAAGETMILLEEFLGAMGVALVNPEMQEALRKRGLTKEQVFCIPLTAGAFGEPEEQGRRLMKVPCLASPSGSNFYAKPIEGLFAVIDLNKKEVVRLVDTGVRPVPVDAWGYTDDENAAREDPCGRSPTPPACRSRKVRTTRSTAAR